ncbi:hypothetical protein [uncultured Clostridium sp.]|uniref:hypothetical protein n=1 Tax=uncultured Clostridium sp. TaxID=59620 RepID=UPI003216CB03
MTNKEYKEWLKSLTLGEIKARYYNELDNIERYKQSIKDDSIRLSNLDINNNKYFYDMEYLVDGMKTTKGFMKEAIKDINLIKPILDKKELEGIDQAEYERYMANNKDNIEVLIKAVQDKEKEFIDNGCKVIVATGKGEDKEIIVTEDEAHRIHDDLLKETILIIKDNVGDIEKVEKLQYNNNKGFDCIIKGTKGTININTILAGGYNIQKLHYRTLVERW